MSAGRTRDAGLGPFPVFTLAKARELAEDCRRSLAAGKDPVEERRAARQAAHNQGRPGAPSGYAGEFITAHEAGWRNNKHRAQWRATLETYAHPVIGQLLVDAIGTQDVLRVLQPIRTAKPETASRVRGRIEAILMRQRRRGCAQARTRHGGVVISTVFCRPKRRCAA